MRDIARKWHSWCHPGSGLSLVQTYPAGERAQGVGAGPSEAEQRGQRLTHLRVLADMLRRDAARSLQAGKALSRCPTHNCARARSM